jgi:hypothetical protein
MTRLAITIVALVITTGAAVAPSTAQAQTTEVRDLLRFERATNEMCRGWGDDKENERDTACCLRTMLQVRLNRAGWCYGKQGQYGAPMEWHLCTSRSHYGAEDYCSKPLPSELLFPRQ